MTRAEGGALGQIATAWAELMRRLGYGRYGAQGGDYGAFVAPELGRADTERVIDVHVNAATYGFIPFGEVAEEELATFTETEQARVARLGNYMREGNGYFQIQATRPQTLAYGSNDSPVGWQIVRQGTTATLVIEPFVALAAAERAALEEEGGRLLAFAAAEATRCDVRFAAAA